MSKFLKAFKRVLLLAPHTDDEFGALGTLNRLVCYGATIKLIAFSKCVESVPDEFPKDILQAEAFELIRLIG